MSKHYPISSYDKYLALKVSPVMWLIFLFLLRPYVVFIGSITNRKDKMMIIDLFYPDKLTLSLGAFAAVPAALLIYAWTRKNPDASPFIRRVWNNGRILLAATAILNAFVVFVPLWLGKVYKLTAFGWGQLLISLLIVLVLYKSQYIKDCFGDFPEKGSQDG